MKKNNGFTLVELLISISIIAILTILASISYTKVQKDGRDQRRIEDLKAIQNAAEQYYLLTGGLYPSSGYSAGSEWKVGIGANAQVVLQRFPGDPKGTSYDVNASSSTGYCICATLEEPKNGNAFNSDDCDFQNISNFYCVKNRQ